MRSLRFQFTTARLLGAIVPIAIICVIVVSLSDARSVRSSLGPPTWFLCLCTWLTVVSLVALFGAVIGVLWEGEEGLILGMFLGVIVSVALAPLAMIPHF